MRIQGETPSHGFRVPQKIALPRANPHLTCESAVLAVGNAPLRSTEKPVMVVHYHASIRYNAFLDSFSHFNNYQDVKYNATLNAPYIQNDLPEAQTSVLVLSAALYTDTADSLPAL